VTDVMPRLTSLTPQRARELAADPDRARLLDRMKSAATFDELEAAGHAQLSWLRANPDDFGVLGAGESLSRSFEALCLRLLLAMGYEAVSDPRYGDLVLWHGPRQPPGCTIAVECVWTHGSVGLEALQVLEASVRRLHASEGLLITNTDVGPQSRDVAAAGNVKLMDGRVLRAYLDEYASDLQSESSIGATA
jgi:hypothetical protein